MNLPRMLALTQELINARGPVGQEEQVREIVHREFKNLCDKIWVDDADNLVGLVRGRASRKGAKAKSSSPIKVMAHMDELSLIVKRVDSDGTLRVRPLGGIMPWAFGLGHVEILGDERMLPGILSVGPLHITPESAVAWKAKPAGGSKGLEWPDVHVFTRLSKEEVEAAGVHAGTRVVIAQTRRHLIEIGDCIAGYFLDDRLCITIMLAAMAMLKEERVRLPQDVYFVATCQEEIGGGSAAHAALSLPGALTMAIDVGPVAPEYGTKLTDEPIVVYRDMRNAYTKSVADRLLRLGRDLGMLPQAAHWENYGSDAGHAKSVGNTPRSALLCIPTENTHGLEIVPRGAIENCAKLLAAYLKDPMQN